MPDQLKRQNISAETRQKILDKLPPNNLQAERAVLGSALVNNEFLPDLINVLNEEVFYYKDNRLIYQAMVALYQENKPVDLLTVTEYLSNRGQLQDAGGYEYIGQLSDAAPILQNFDFYADIVIEKAKLRQLISTLNDLLAHCYGDSEEIDKIIDVAAKRLYEIRESKDSRGFAKLGPVIAERLNALEEYAKSGHQDMIRSGFQTLDECLGGLKKGALLIIAARPGMGKTALALNIAHKAATLYGEPTAIFSLEMSKEELANRFLASHMSIDSRKFSNADLTAADWQKITDEFASIYPSPIYIDDRSGISTVEMLAKCRQLKLEGKLSLVIVDYLQLMAGNTGRPQDSRQQEISDISRQLKVMARELEVPVIALSQLSRSVEARKDKRPILSDLRDSGAIEQDADVVMFIYRSSVYEEEAMVGETEEAELIIAKNRHGATKSFPIGWMPKYTTFFELDFANELDRQADRGLPEPPPY